MARIYQTVLSMCNAKRHEVEESDWRTFGEKDQFVKGMEYALAILGAMQSKGELYHDEMRGKPSTADELLILVRQRIQDR